MLRCDFCGRESERVSRVALDKDYDRITEKHRKMYACQECSRKKDEERKKNEGKMSKSDYLDIVLRC